MMVIVMIVMIVMYDDGGGGGINAHFQILAFTVLRRMILQWC